MRISRVAVIVAVISAAPPRPAAAQADPDLLYRERATLARAREAIDIWEARLKANARDFESAWKISRATYWLGKHEERDQGRRTLERGIAAGRQAASIRPERPEGHFWMAASMGALAESFGLRQGLRYRGAIKDALERVLKLDPAFMDGSADRALGRWYHMVPGLFGGSESKSEEHLRTSLTYKPDSIASLFFLAETLLERDKDADALAALEKIATAPLHPDFEPEDREFKTSAAELAQRLREQRARPR